MSERCETCRFWNRAKKANWQDFDGKRSYIIAHAECRRYAPARMPSDSKVSSSVWPHVNANDFCGDHRPAALHGDQEG